MRGWVKAFFLKKSGVIAQPPGFSKFLLEALGLPESATPAEISLAILTLKYRALLNDLGLPESATFDQARTAVVLLKFPSMDTYVPRSLYDIAAREALAANPELDLPSLEPVLIQ